MRPSEPGKPKYPHRAEGRRFLRAVEAALPALTNAERARRLGFKHPADFSAIVNGHRRISPAQLASVRAARLLPPDYFAGLPPDLRPPPPKPRPAHATRLRNTIKARESFGPLRPAWVPGTPVQRPYAKAPDLSDLVEWADWAYSEQLRDPANYVPCDCAECQAWEREHGAAER